MIIKHFSLPEIHRQVFFKKLIINNVIYIRSFMFSILTRDVKMFFPLAHYSFSMGISSFQKFSKNLLWISQWTEEFTGWLIVGHRSTISDLRSQTWDHRPKISDLRSQTENLRLKITDQRLQTWDLRSKIMDQRSQTWDLRPKIIDIGS